MQFVLHIKNSIQDRIRSEKGESFIRWLLLLSGFLSAPFFTRLILINGRGKNLIFADIGGFISDLALTLILACVYLIVAKRSRIAGSILLLTWCAFHYSNFEHVVANGDVISLSYVKYLFSPTFLFGSAIVVSNIFLTALIFTTTLAVVFIKIKQLKINLLGFGVIMGIASLGIGTRSIFTTVLDPRWRSYNVIHANIEDICCAKFKKIDLSITASLEEKYKSLLNKEMDGTPFVTINKKGHNVLLVVLEGGCGGMLPSVGEHQGIHSEISMPKLDSIARANIIYTNFITLQRQTNRGMFSILSGSYPKLNSSTPKMTEYVTKKNLENDCSQEYLPELLAKHGYETTYLQASPLPYMLKDIFMKQAGFKHCYGTQWFTHSYSSNYWGIDDKAFFEQAFNHIASKKNSRKPWFMTLLTVGTHHPLNIPDDYGNIFEETKRQRAYQYLDEAVQTFITNLNDAGILENTLVILTCDESQGVKDLRGDPPGKRLCQQWGILTILHPTEKRYTVNSKYTQFDIALSVVDYLGMPFDTIPFAGRSIFRTYTDERDIYFANTYNHIIGRFTKDNKLEICDENFNYGEQYTIVEDKLFSLEREFKRKLSTDEVSDIARFGHVSNGSILTIENENTRTFDFHSGVTHVISPGRQKTLLGGQFFTIPKNSAVSVQLKGRVISGDSSVVYLKHDLAAKSGKVRIVKYMPKELKAGNFFSTSYSFYSPEEFYSSEFRVTAQLLNGNTATIILDEASLTYSIRPPTSRERKCFYKRYNKNVGRDTGAYIMVEQQNCLKVTVNFQ